MAYSTRFVVGVASLVLFASPLLAHHKSFYQSTFNAIQRADLEGIKDLFSTSAWEGEEGVMSAAQLQERLKKGERIPLYPGHGTDLPYEQSSYDEARSKCLVGFKLEYPGGEVEEIWLLAEDVDPAFRSWDWRITRVVNDVTEAEAFLGRKFDSRNLPVGRWSIGFANEVTQVCEVSKDGTVTVVEPSRTARGKATVKQGSVLVTYDDGRVERWTPVGQRLVVEHWHPAARFPAGAAVLGIADLLTPVEVTSLDQAKSLAPGTTSVSAEYSFELKEADQFSNIMRTLAGNPSIRHLTLRLPNSTHVKDETLDVLREFQSLETLELFDARHWEAPTIFEQVAAMENLRQVKLSFLCRSPSEAACKAALPKMKNLESATFSDGRPHTREGWEEALNKFASELVAEHKAEQND